MVTGGVDVDPARYGEAPAPGHLRLRAGHRRVRAGAAPGRHRRRHADARRSAAAPRCSTCCAAARSSSTSPTTSAKARTASPTSAGGKPNTTRARRRLQLAAAFGARSRWPATCHHHQAIDALGKGLRRHRPHAPTASSRRSRTRMPSWLVAVQWHPEDSSADRPGAAAPVRPLRGRGGRSPLSLDLASLGGNRRAPAPRSPPETCVRWPTVPPWPTPRRIAFPAHGTAPDELLAELRAARADDLDWRGGRAFSLVYNADDDELEDAARRGRPARSCTRTRSTRSLPEPAADGARGRRHGRRPASARRADAGAMTSGGTESIFLAVQTARDQARAGAGHRRAAARHRRSPRTRRSPRRPLPRRRARAGARRRRRPGRPRRHRRRRRRPHRPRRRRRRPATRTA